MLRIRRHLWGEGQSQDTWGVWSRQLPRVKMCESECDNTFSCILIKVYLHYHHLRCSGYIKGLLKKPRQSIGLQILTPLTTAGDQRVKWLQAAVWRRKQQTSELRVLDEQRSHGRLTVRIRGTKARTKSLKSFPFFFRCLFVWSEKQSSQKVTAADGASDTLIRFTSSCRGRGIRGNAAGLSRRVVSGGEHDAIEPWTHQPVCEHDVSTPYNEQKWWSSVIQNRLQSHSAFRLLARC